MAGGLMQLIAYGAQDIYLTGNADETYFRVIENQDGADPFSFDALTRVLDENQKQLDAENLQRWKEEIKPFLAEIRALPPILSTFYGGVEYIDAMEEFYSYTQR